MHSDIDRILMRYGRVASRAMLLQNGISRHTLDNEVKRGALVTILPRTYCRPWDVDDVEIRERAALTSVGRPASLSHLSGLRRWDLLDANGNPVHITVPASRFPRGHGGDLVIHRADHLPPVVRRNRLITVSAATAVTTSWPLLTGPDQRAPAIVAVRKRLVTPQQLRESIDRSPRQVGRSEVVQLIDLLEAGCESELEIWGYLDVFNIPGLRHAARQKWITVRGRKYRLDQAYEEERVAVELDGAAYHSSPTQREKDARRDAALATIGWLTLRYSHSRLHEDRDGCRRDTLETLAARR